MKPVTITIPTFNLRKLPDPNPKGSVPVVYFTAKVADLPVDELVQWRDVNPRDVKKSTVVYQSILSTLKNEPSRFYLRNRGITLSSADFSYDEKNKEVKIVFSNKSLHGVIDGGHTLAACGDAVDDEDADGIDSAYVHIKLLVGLISDTEVAEVAGGLNSSQQVDLRSLENLMGHFDALKNAIKDESYADKIAFRMNDVKPIDAREILYYLALFDAKKFGPNHHPVALFGRKEGLVREFAKEAKGSADAAYHFETLITRARDILRLRDELERELLQPKYNLGRYKVAGSKKTRVRSKNNQSKRLNFLNVEVDGSLPLGWIMPMLGAFRANVEWNDKKGTFSWKVPNATLLPLVAERLAATVTEIHTQEGARPEYVGRNATAWRSCYSVLENQILRYELDSMNKS